VVAPLDARVRRGGPARRGLGGGRRPVFGDAAGEQQRVERGAALLGVAERVRLLQAVPPVAHGVRRAARELRGDDGPLRPEPAEYRQDGQVLGRRPTHLAATPVRPQASLFHEVVGIGRAATQGAGREGLKPERRERQGKLLPLAPTGQEAVFLAPLLVRVVVDVLSVGQGSRLLALKVGPQPLEVRVLDVESAGQLLLGHAAGVAG